MLSYALRNTLHYRGKYAAAFGLICVVAFLLCLSLFMLRGVRRESAEFSRAYGDVQVGSRGSEFTPKLAGAVEEYFLKDGKSEKAIGLTWAPGGKGFNSKGQWSLSALQLDEVRRLAEVRITEGEAPAEGEALLPFTFRKKIRLGETFTFLFKNWGQILDSRKLRVSGFYSPLSQFHDRVMLVDRAQFLSMYDMMTIPNSYYVFLSGYGPRILTGPEFEDLKEDIKSDFKSAGAEVDVAGISINRHEQSEQYIGLFLVISIIFVVVLVVITAMTIVNVLFLALLDRIRIVATFLSFGMTKAGAVLLLSCELLIFALAASGLGIALACAASRLLPLWQFDVYNYIIYMLLGDARRIPTLPNAPDALLTLAVGTAFPFVTALFAIRRLLKGELAQLLSFKK